MGCRIVTGTVPEGRVALPAPPTRHALTKQWAFLLIHSDDKTPTRAEPDSRPQQSLARLRTLFIHQASCTTTIKNWFAEPKRGRVNFGDELRDGRLSSVVNNKNIDAVRRMIKTIRHVTYHAIQAFLGIGTSQIQSNLHTHFGVKKLCSWWITHNLTEPKKTDSVTWSNAILTRFKEGASNLVWVIVTGDKTWIYCYNSKKKQQSTVWIY
ncbi:hypothetical protein EVAR_10886_1 [Eumeta japonica]|uniref:Histone-lysine N-methyltransferase SETMAR n=1 Tax=Eumeta variegata TaxID=151549 RepID=A0A4C1US75_EUMVA|nr:hypothetical protein EVAR_10886_1 [Eumeta japonica]